MDIYVKDEKLLRLKSLINTAMDQKSISKVTICHNQFGLLVNMINCIQHINRRSYQGDKVSEHETDHSSPSRTEVKNLCS